ncbi:MAG: N-acetylmuramic acid 6-phosphate etherase, partial [Betaproteobacteria bacterium]|nr:N-acetylmuramic acid 6-phosphate etherase [Betaproteobacteria bacterium]
ALGALREARAAGALTIALANNPGAPLIEQAEIGILLDTGAEVISGSTRLKAATAQKIALNSFSSALMVKLHKVHGNLMVDLRASNAKLRRRALHLTVLVSEASETAAAQALAECGWRVKIAIVMLRCKLDAAGAEQRLSVSEGSLRGALPSA